MPAALGLGVVFHPSPLDARAIGALVAKYRLTFLLSTPTFLQTYTRRCEAEEFGSVLCLILVALFALIVIRALTKAMASDDQFIRFATAGLAMLFGMQSAINMAVNLHLMPAKGMTLPFISYGGSSLISLAYGMGMLVALTRERPRAKLASVSGLAASPA